MLLIGVDDAGRGPLIGPMILAGVIIDKEDEAELKKIGAKDSKLLSHPERVRLAEIIKKKVRKYAIVKVYPDEIDRSVGSANNLNTLEAQKMADVINQLNDSKKQIKIIVDCPSVNIEAWKLKLVRFITNVSNLKVSCEHKADLNHPVVSAASIIAKVAREDEVSLLKKQYGDFGSGYPSDPFTKAFLKQHGLKLKDSGIFRKSWATWKSMFPETEKKQKSLLDY